MYKNIICVTIISCMALQVIGQITRDFETCAVNAGNGLKYICKDCSTIQMCNGANLMYEVPCEDQLSGNPYCNATSNSCVATQTECSVTDFMCPDVGLFPSPNCRNFYACSETAEGIIPEVRTCLYRSVYNDSEKACVTNSLCYSPVTDCAGKFDLIPYRPNPNSKYYVLCRGTEEPVILLCPEGLVFDFNNAICIFKCTKEGIFADTSDGSMNKYVTCVYNGSSMKQIPQTCSGYQVFDPQNKVCVVKPQNETGY